MELDRIAIAPRLRTSWEAIDLGFLMARRWYWPLFACWALPCLVLTTLAVALLPGSPGYAVLLVWWLKPLLDRAPLYFLSQALFDEPITIRQCLAGLFSLWRKGCIPWLLWRRFNFNRSFDMPVTLLEGLSGPRGRQRLSVLHRQNTGAAFWLTVIGLGVELLIVCGLVFLLKMMVPDEFTWRVMKFVFAHEQVTDWAFFALAVLAMALVAPFYIAAGFALYISRRIELEAWDIEIRFRHLVKKYLARPLSSLLSLLLLVLCIASVAVPEIAVAGAGEAATGKTTIDRTIDRTNDSKPPAIVGSAAEAKTLINQTLAGEDFHEVVETSGWRLKPAESEEGNAVLPQWFVTLVEWLDRVLSVEAPADEESDEPDLEWLAAVIEVFLWATMALLLVLFLFFYRREIRNAVIAYRDKRQPRPETPQMLFGLEVSRESLPDDIPGLVRHYSREGDFRQALSLLYRSTLSGLMHNHGFVFNDSHTEGECVALVRVGGNVALSSFTEELTGFWQSLAYGHREPGAQVVDHLCIRWQELFDDEE
ncbi:hypothetical protein [Pseudomaricurvus sp. HS19]|uniref:hypothetical protein n=1 Tax=Pseudomaricurvus sp. HS19 TaxID=2692626 RepID=UPI001369E076|nr:hypothetical protein [Pseudomaricurvus sp. HS19]MYM62946.1 hypothetical protein [Pseudomaricurvus sp. HS19]